MLSVVRHQKRSDVGASTVEAALFLPLFLIIFGGIIDFSLFFATHAVAKNAATVGARAMSTLENYTIAEYIKGADAAFEVVPGNAGIFSDFQAIIGPVRELTDPAGVVALDRLTVRFEMNSTYRTIFLRLLGINTLNATYVAKHLVDNLKATPNWNQTAYPVGGYPALIDPGMDPEGLIFQNERLNGQEGERIMIQNGVTVPLAYAEMGIPASYTVREAVSATKKLDGIVDQNLNLAIRIFDPDLGILAVTRNEVSFTKDAIAINP